MVIPLQHSYSGESSGTEWSPVASPWGLKESEPSTEQPRITIEKPPLFLNRGRTLDTQRGVVILARALQCCPPEPQRVVPFRTQRTDEGIFRPPRSPQGQ